MGAITKWLIGGSPATAEVNRLFILNDPSLCIYHPETATYLQRAAFNNLKKSFSVFHDHRRLICKTYFPVCAVTIGHAT